MLALAQHPTNSNGCRDRLSIAFLLNPVESTGQTVELNTSSPSAEQTTDFYFLSCTRQNSLVTTTAPATRKRKAPTGRNPKAHPAKMQKGLDSDSDKERGKESENESEFAASAKSKKHNHNNHNTTTNNNTSPSSLPASSATLLSKNRKSIPGIPETPDGIVDGLLCLATVTEASLRSQRDTSIKDRSRHHSTTNSAVSCFFAQQCVTLSEREKMEQLFNGFNADFEDYAEFDNNNACTGIDLFNTAGSATNQQRGRRRRISPQQAAILNKIFETCNHPNPAQRSVLASQLRMTTEQVSLWFQNKRARVKRKSKKSEKEMED